MQKEEGIRFEEDREDFDWGKGKDSIKEIILRHIRKISDITSKEFTAGYWQERPVKVGGGVMMSKEYHPDQREAYNNAVDFLTDVVFPNSDEEFKKKLENIEEEEEEAWKEAQKDEWDRETWIKTKLRFRRMILKEIFIMFERYDYFAGEETYEE